MINSKHNTKENKVGGNKIIMAPFLNTIKIKITSSNYHNLPSQ